MAFQRKKPVNPIFLPIIALPHFFLACILAGINWNRMGRREKARSTVKWGLVGTVVILVIALYFPPDVIKRLWSVGLGINIGTGMALRTLQLPDYNQAVAGPARK